MSISKDELVKRKEQIKKDFDALVKQIDEQEGKIKSMKNNLQMISLAIYLVVTQKFLQLHLQQQNSQFQQRLLVRH